MIPNVKDRALTSSGVAASGAFGISLDDSAHLMTILRDTLYSDKILAVLREYSANAWDAHRAVGKADVPISVTLPTPLSPTLEIQDFGPGLSRDDVFNVYTQYGKSSKRGDDVAVGMLGIGSKSGFSYSDSFTIVSRHGGKKSTYVAVLDETDKGMMNLLHEEDCGEETGITIKIAVNRSDFDDFQKRAEDLFVHFRPVPKCNIPLIDLTTLPKTMPSGYLIANDSRSYHDRGWVAVMGCIPYRINLGQVKDLPRYVNEVSGVLYFNIGDVQINASREELKYSEDTKTAIRAKIESLVEEFVRDTLSDIFKENATPWEKKLKAQIFRKLHLPVPKDLKELADSYVRVDFSQESFLIQKKPIKKSDKTSVREASAFHVKDRARIILIDDRRSRGGYALTEDDYLVYKRDPKKAWDEIKADVEKFLEPLGLTGMPIVCASTLDWRNPNPGKGGGIKTRKHVARVFQFVRHPEGRTRESDHWDIVTIEPKKEDVYVLLDHFEADMYGFQPTYDNMKSALAFIGRKMPPVYGYKTTEKRPVKRDDVTGTHFSSWSEDYWKGITHSYVKELCRQKAVVDDWKGFQLRFMKQDLVTKTILALGPGHEVSLAVRKFMAANRTLRRLSISVHNAIDKLSEFQGLRCEEEEDWVRKVNRSLQNRYPLLGHGGINELLMGGMSRHWFEYIQLKDKKHDDDTRLQHDQRVDLHCVAGTELHDPQAVTQLRVGAEGHPRRAVG